MNTKITFELAQRLNEIEVEINKLELERLKIIKVLQNRIPSLKNDINLQPKKKVRKYEKIIKE